MIRYLSLLLDYPRNSGYVSMWDTARHSRFLLNAATRLRHGKGKVAGRGANDTDNAELVAALHTRDEIWSPEALYERVTAACINFTASCAIG